MDEAIQEGVPKKTQEDSIYRATLWKEWVIHRAKATGVVISAGRYTDILSYRGITMIPVITIL